MDTVAVFQSLEQDNMHLLFLLYSTYFLLFFQKKNKSKATIKNASVSSAGIAVPLTPRWVNFHTDQYKKHFPQVFMDLLIYLCAKGIFMVNWVDQSGH